MAKNDLKQVKQNTQQQQNNTNQQYSQANQQANERSQQQYNTANERGADTWGGYSNLASTGGVNWDIAKGMSGIGGANSGNPVSDSGTRSSGSGGVAVTPQQDFRQFNAVHPYSEGLASTGGVDMNRLTSTSKDYRDIADNPFDKGAQDRIGEDIAGFRQMASTGGLTEADKNNYLGNGVYKNFSETGGFSQDDQNLYRQRATAMVPALYQQMADDMQRRRAVQGGYSPGFSAGSALLARNASQSMNDATRGAENDLQGQIRSNKLAGAQGLQSGQGAFSSLKTGNQLAGGQAAAGTEMAVQDAINRYKMGALGALTNENQTAEQIAQQGKIAGTGFLTAQGQSLTNQDIASNQTGAAVGMNNANINAANQRYLLGLQQSGMMGGLQGMQGLYGTNVASGQNYFGSNMSGIGGQAGANNNYLGSLERNAEQTSGFMDYLSKGMGMAGGLLGGFGGEGSGGNGFSNLMGMFGGGGGSGAGNPTSEGFRPMTGNYYGNPQMSYYNMPAGMLGGA